MSKLDDLCAIKVMGWEYLNEANGYKVFMEAGERIAVKWNPSTSLDDALVVINKVSKRWQLDTWQGSLTQRYSCGVYDEDEEEQYGAQGDSAAVALCLTALRAMGVPESEISLAMEN